MTMGLRCIRESIALTPTASSRLLSISVPIRVGCCVWPVHDIYTLDARASHACSIPFPSCPSLITRLLACVQIRIFIYGAFGVSALIGGVTSFSQLAASEGIRVQKAFA